MMMIPPLERVPSSVMGEPSLLALRQTYVAHLSNGHQERVMLQKPGK